MTRQVKQVVVLLFTYSLSFCASGIKSCMPGYPAVLAWLCLQVHTNPHRESWKPVVIGHSNGQHHDQYSRSQGSEQYFQANRPHYHALHVALFPSSPCTASDGKLGGAWERSYIIHVATHVPKAYNFELWLFKKCKGSIERKLKFIFYVEKNNQEIRQLI